ncbi:hypothetical protein RG963_16070 [Methanosarcina sp. Z-7115]|uniref:Lipoprotein n=1 Tax=Methanosarcina baikalica TaxID=3073890 RepID=A0ABU2D5K7_9EURY|nr:hypothetical protein [Methanosarcina sp. Z-7115]MCO5382659.1 hypothetical protein [Methanosarcina sp. ERenArc_MAG2]MDR7667263.1 hypothetical protein [Methanosarcina sp. Z-7115]
MKKYVYLILFVLLASMLCIGCTDSNSQQKTSQIASAPDQSENTQSADNQDAEWAKSTSNSVLIFANDTAQFSNSINNKDYYTAIKGIEKYIQALETEIKNIDNYKVSSELQSCKDEYKLALIDDYNAATFMKSGVTQLTSGNFLESAAAAKMGTEGLRLANSHYDNVTSLVKIYNDAHPDSQIEVNFLYHNVGPEENSQDEVATSEQTSTPGTKTLADKEPESDEPHANEDSNDVEDSSTSNIFDYCTWQAEITKKIGEYYKASGGKSYVVVSIKLDNTGDQTYSTNPVIGISKLAICIISLTAQHTTAL